MAGRSPRPQSRSSGRYLHAPSSAHLSHSSKVTSRRPIAKGFGMVTRCAGFSYSKAEPISKVPAGTTTSSAHPVQSRKMSPALEPARGGSLGDGAGADAAGGLGEG